MFNEYHPYLNSNDKVLNNYELDFIGDDKKEYLTNLGIINDTYCTIYNADNLLKENIK